MMRRTTGWWLLVPLVAACNVGTDRANAAVDSVPVAPAQSPATAGASAPAATTAGTVPTPLEAAEGLAEDVQTDIAGSNWTAAAANAKELQNTAAGVVSAAGPGASAAYRAAVDSLAAQVGRRDRAASLVSANAVSRDLVRMFVAFHPKVPVQVAYMDVAGRDVVYAAERGDWSAATRAVQELRTNYDAVQAHVSASNPALANRVAGELQQVADAVQGKNAAEAKRTGNVLLEEVDLIEKTY